MRSCSTPKRCCLSGLMPVEWLLLFAGVCIWGLYCFFDLEMPGQPGEASRYGPIPFYLKQVYASFYLYALLFVATTFGYLYTEYASSRSDVRPFRVSRVFDLLGARFQPQECFTDARLLHSVVLMFVEFQLLKHLIPHVNPVLFDDWFAAFDHLICGTICGEQLFALLGERSVHSASQHYTWYFPFMIGVVLLMLGTATRRVQHEYVLSFTLLFLIGILWVFIFPTWGPVFYFPERFAFVKDSASGLLQEDLWGMKRALDANPLKQGVVFSISGFPSLHVAVVTLAAIYTFRIHPWIGLASASFLLLTLNSTLLLGWHYLLDDLGAFLLVFLSVWVAKRFQFDNQHSV